MDPVTFLPITQQLCYSVGHSLNDLCAAMWFTYFLLFYQHILGFEGPKAGVMMLIGQVIDALSTLLLGYISDKRSYSIGCRYGRRKSWHLLGTLLVLASFPFIFHRCLNCEGASHNLQMLYYTFFIIIFQFGWACVQVSHLALIPELTPDEHRRTRLTSMRSMCTIICTILVYSVTLTSMEVADKASSHLIRPEDSGMFEMVVYVVIAIGSITSIIFHVGVREVSFLVRLRQSQKTVADFLKDPQTYLVAIVFTCARLFVNLCQTYVTLYLHEYLQVGAKSLTLVPLVMYVGSLAATAAVDPCNKYLGRVISYMIGIFIGVLDCFWIYFASGKREYEVYLIGILLGISGSIMLVTTLGITVDLIGPDTDTGAFVYGSMSFTDKLVNGVAVMLIQQRKCTSGCPNYYRDVLAFVCGGTAVIGLLPLFFLRNLSDRYLAPTAEPATEDLSALPMLQPQTTHGTF